MSWQPFVKALEAPSPREESWSKQHNDTLVNPFRPVEASILAMLRGWYFYAQQHELRFASKLGDDGILGVAWLAMARSLVAMLNGELGRLDAGTLDKFIRRTIVDAGFTQEEADNA